MVLLTEQERKIADEKQLIDDATAYTLPAAFGTARSYGNITLTQPGLVAFQFSLWEDYGLFSYQLRLSVGGVKVWGTGAPISSSQGTAGGGIVAGFNLLAYLNAGTYAILVEGKTSTANKFKVQNFKCGFGTFQDLSGTNLAAYAAPAVVNTPSRETPIGTLSKTTLYIRVAAQTAAAVTSLENVGDNLTNGVFIAIDGVQVSFLQRYQDTDVANLNTASGLIVQSYPTGADHTIAISKRNANTTTQITVIACPWILGTTPDYPKTQYPFPVAALTIPQGSTLYVMLEPYDAFLDKFIGVGKSRLVSHGLTRDYYASQTSTEILTFNYTFEIVDTSTIVIVANGVGGCISYIGADISG